MTKRFLELLRRGWRKPPGVIARWLVRQARAEWDQHRAPARARALTPERLLIALGGDSLDALWKRLAEAPFPAFTEPLTPKDYDKACPGDAERILKAAGDAIEARVDLLGSGPVTLGRPIPWHQDFKSGHRWPLVMFRRIEVMDLGRDSDVKVPWELSRLQWLIPAGQAYLMTGGEPYATTVRDVALLQELWVAFDSVTLENASLNADVLTLSRSGAAFRVVAIDIEGPPISGDIDISICIQRNASGPR